MANCKKCGKKIRGKIKIQVRRRKVGKKLVVETDYFDEECFYELNLEKAKHEDKSKSNKRKN
jgi:hypothetical protein